MEDEGEPHLEDRICEPDRFEVLLDPRDYPGEGVHAFLNPAVCPQGRHCLYRTIIAHRDPKKRFSAIGYGEFTEPFHITNLNPFLIMPEQSLYPEGRGCEDPRITQIGDTYFITYVGFDGAYPRVLLATTKDFTSFNKLGQISPDILLEDAIKLAQKGRGNEEYVKVWKALLRRDHSALLTDKDAILLRPNGRYCLIHRWEPNIQVTFFENLSDLKDLEFWEYNIAHVGDQTLIRRKQSDWDAVKVGAGAILPEEIGFILGYHGVDENFDYSVNYALLDPDTLEVMSTLEEPPIKAESELHRYYNTTYRINGKPRWRKIAFLSGLAKDDKWIRAYLGLGDRRIAGRSHLRDWLLSSLLYNAQHKRAIMGGN